MSDSSETSAPEAPVWLESFLLELRAAGTPEETLRFMAEEIRRTHDSDAEYHCAVCGRSSGAIVAFEKDDGGMIYSSPSRFVYAYRDHRPHGLCDQCFAQGRFERFSPAEIQYFRENFVEEDVDAEPTG